MFKRDILRQIIPDIVIALGFFLLFLGLLNLLQGKDFQHGNLENKGILEQKDVVIGELDITEKDIGFPDIVLELPDVQESDGFQEIELQSEELAVEEADTGENAVEDLAEKLPEEVVEVFADNSDMVPDTDARTGIDVHVVNIVIPEGSTGRQVARILDEEGLIPFDDFIELLLLFDIETRIKAGAYTFNNDSSIADILSEILIKRR